MTVTYYRIAINLSHTQPFNGPLSRTTRVSRYQKGKTNLDFTEARDGEWQWHPLGYMQVCTSLQTDNHASTPPLSFFTGWMPFLPPNQQRQTTEGNVSHLTKPIKYAYRYNCLWQADCSTATMSCFMFRFVVADSAVLQNDVSILPAMNIVRPFTQSACQLRQMRFRVVVVVLIVRQTEYIATVFSACSHAATTYFSESQPTRIHMTTFIYWRSVDTETSKYTPKFTPPIKLLHRLDFCSENHQLDD